MLKLFKKDKKLALLKSMKIYKCNSMHKHFLSANHQQLLNLNANFHDFYQYTVGVYFNIASVNTNKENDELCITHKGLRS